MKSILFVLRKSLKNTLLELLHHPGKLVLYILVFGMIIFSGVINMTVSTEHDTMLDTRVLQGLYFAVLLFILVISLLKGIDSGASIFSMPDVNYFFSAPLSPKKILVYGLMKQMGTTLLIALFLISYGGLAVSMFGITPTAAILMLVGFAVTVFLTQMLTMLLYSYSNGNEKRIRVIKALVYALVLGVLAFVALSISTKGFTPENAYAVVASPVIDYIPIAGWMKGLLFGFIEGNAASMLLFGALLAVSAVAMVILFLRSDADYYEDVLESAESTYELKKAVKEGRVVNTSGMASKTPKVRDTGIGGGWGASAFFYKQMREMKRRSRLIFVGTSTLGALAASLFMVIVMGRSDDMSPSILMMVGAIMAVYVLFFLNATGEFSREMIKPYLYLVPASPFKKLMWASLTSLLKPVVDGVLVFLVVGVVAKADVVTILMCMLLYMSFGFLFTSCNVLSTKVLGQVANKGLMMVAYMLMLMVIVAPGLAAGIILGVNNMMAATGIPTALVMGAPLVVWNIGVSFLLCYLCRGILHDMEVK